jgi:beta-galactosidase
VTPEAAKNLEAYVRGGGHLVLTQRSAMKDEDNSLYPQRQPGPLAELLGARVEQWYALDKPVPIDGEWGAGEDRMWAEQLSVSSPETKVLMRYGKSNGWLDGQPAAVTRLRRTRQCHLHRRSTGRRNHEGRGQVDDGEGRSRSDHERSAGRR